MSRPFGDGPFEQVRRAEVVTGDADLQAALRALAEQGVAPRPTLLLGRCEPTAAFSRRDTLLPGHRAAAETALAHGFTPVVRPVGGHLAAYDTGSLVVHLWAPHPEPRAQIRPRFEQAGSALVGALRTLGVPDPRLGPVPGEYCEGAWSVNAGGRSKIAGTGQRITRHGFLFSAVVTVEPPVRVRPVLVAAYHDLGLLLDPSSIGSVSDWVAGVSIAEAAHAVGAALVETLADVPLPPTSPERR